MEIPRDLEEMFEVGERVIWAGKPSKTPFVVKKIGFSLIAVPWLLFPLFMLNATSWTIVSQPFVCLFLVFWYGILGFISLGSPVYSFLVWRNIFYVLTDRRIIVRKGLIGIDYDVLSLDVVQQVNIDVGFWDKLYGTGTVTVQAIGVQPVVLRCIRSPRKVQGMIGEAVKSWKGRLKV